MKEFFKIGEISKLYHIGTDSLRYYEELGILTPKRGQINIAFIVLMIFGN